MPNSVFAFSIKIFNLNLKCSYSQKLHITFFKSASGIRACSMSPTTRMLFKPIFSKVNYINNFHSAVPINSHVYFLSIIEATMTLSFQNISVILLPIWVSYVQYRQLIPAPVDRTSVSSWSYKHAWTKCQKISHAHK